MDNVIPPAGGSEMPTLEFNDLIEYTDWERGKWHDWFRQHGDQVLKISIGPNGDGRFKTAGDVVRHIFSAEKRYVERLLDRPLTDTASIPNDNVEALFVFGQESRKALREFVETLPAHRWDVSNEFKILNDPISVTTRKTIAHVLIHEIRHWAQIAALFRLNGLPGEFHDFLFSPVMDGESRNQQSKR
jgi:uncharacterized damage-inducible protein DinB